MFTRVMAMCAILAGASVAHAAVVFEPLQVQHRGYGGEIYYYGGRNPDVVRDSVRRDWVMRHVNPNYSSYPFIYSTVRTPAVYSDAAPYMDLSVYGFTPTDVINEANASLPRYFRKGDLYAAGHFDHAGNLVIPANARPVSVRPAVQPTTRPTTEAIIIIPLPKKAHPAAPTGAKVADAR